MSGPFSAHPTMSEGIYPIHTAAVQSPIAMSTQPSKAARKASGADIDFINLVADGLQADDPDCVTERLFPTGQVTPDLVRTAAAIHVPVLPSSQQPGLVALMETLAAGLPPPLPPHPGLLRPSPLGHMQGPPSFVPVGCGLQHASEDHGVVLGEIRQDFRSHYVLGRLLGEGGLGRVFSASPIANPELSVAVKIVVKANLTVEQLLQLRKEVCIMFFLKSCPNILRIQEVFESDTEVAIVMEECTRSVKDFYASVTWGSASDMERLGAQHFQQMLAAVRQCHASCVIHRDISLDNFLLAKDGSIRLADFGLAVVMEQVAMCQNGTFFEQGTVYGKRQYISPEGACGYFSFKSDIWALGCCLYFTILGSMPYFSPPSWMGDPDASMDLRDLFSGIFQNNVETRFSVDQIVSHPWVTRMGLALPASAGIVARWRRFATLDSIQKRLVLLISQYVRPTHVLALKDVFRTLDLDKSDTISFDEFRHYATSLSIPDEELRAAFDAADIDGSATINSHEFVASYISASELTRATTLRRVFNDLDTDHNGTISAEEFFRGLPLIGGRDADMPAVQAYFGYFDQNSDYQIDFNEFLSAVTALCANLQDDVTCVAEFHG